MSFDTPASLLIRLSDQQNEQRASDWGRFVELYAPLVLRWARQQQLQAADAEDLVQEVMIKMNQVLPKFEYDPRLGFRGYLYRVTRNRLHDLRRKPLQQFNEPFEATLADNDDQLGAFEQREYRAFISHRFLQLIQREFPEKQWRACWMQVAEGETAAETARTLGITKNMAYLARSRVLARLRSELDGMLD